MRLVGQVGTVTNGSSEYRMLDSSNNPWPSKRLRFLTLSAPQQGVRRVVEGSSEVPFLPMRAIGERGQIDLSEIRSVDEASTGYTLFAEGDVVVAKITPCFENGKGALIRGMPDGIGFGTTELYVLRPGPEIDGKFLYYLTVDPSFRKRGEACMTGAAGQQRVPEDFIRDTRVPVPRLSQQHAIADYLDRETARLDALVVETERLLSLLEEKRQALVTRAVTRGLNSDVPFRDSGIAWLGEIPEHWDTERARWLFRERNHRSTTGCEELLTVSHLTGVTPRSEKEVNMFEAQTTEGYKICLRGDLVVNTLWAWMGAMGVAPMDGIVSPDYNVYTPVSALDPEYVHALVRLRVFAQEVTRHSMGVWSSRLRLYPDGFFGVNLPVPPLVEQQEIVRYLRISEDRIHDLKESVTHAHALVGERRAALITGAVFGQIDVENGA